MKIMILQNKIKELEQVIFKQKFPIHNESENIFYMKLFYQIGDTRKIAKSYIFLKSYLHYLFIFTCLQMSDKGSQKNNKTK